jgi:hypothetical protein
VLAVCAAPLVASYIVYYSGIARSLGTTNYGTILDPRQYPMPNLFATTLDGQATSLDAYKGKWVMLKAGPSACDAACNSQLFAMRQLRLMQGKEMERIERVWLVTDAAPIETMLLRQYDGMHVLRVDPATLARWLPVAGREPASEHIYLLDPLGNLMMRFPARADPNQVKKDLAKLLKASSIG